MMVLATRQAPECRQFALCTIYSIHEWEAMSLYVHTTSTRIYILFELLAPLPNRLRDRSHVLQTMMRLPWPRAHEALEQHKSSGQIRQRLLFVHAVRLQRERQRLQQQRTHG